MGIQGLLPFLANSTRDAHISEFENKYVAIDAYCWLHKGIYCCSYDLAMKKPTNKYVTYCLRYIEMLHHFKVKPILVFDGRNLCSKAETEKKRREERQRKYKKGLDLIRADKISEGTRLLAESIDVKHEFVVNLLKECRKMNIDCIVAPYEADAQLSFFSIQKIVDCIITEDSDLLAYGCEKVMFKMDKNGRGRLIEKKNLYLSLNMDPESFSDEKFRYMCILSGCDYLPSLPSIGPANALKFIKLISDQNIFEVLRKLPVYLNKVKITVSSEYILGFKTANNTFMHQLVYDPFLRKQVPLQPVENDDLIVGEKLPENEAFQLAIGNIDPETMTKVDSFNPDKNGQGFGLLWKTDLLPINELRDTLKINQGVIDAKKRRREEYHTSNSIKKYCLSQTVFCKNNEKKTNDKISRTGFIFGSDSVKKNVPDTKDKSSLLFSRYFNSNKKKHLDAKDNKIINKQKNESNEEYLQRLFDENSMEDEDDENDEFAQNKKKCSCGKRFYNLCLECSKCSNCCNCLQHNLTQHINLYIKELKIQKEIEKKNSTQHSLLDEIEKPEEQRISEITSEPEMEKENIEITKIEEGNNSEDFLPSLPILGLNSSNSSTENQVESNENFEKPKNLSMENKFESDNKSCYSKFSSQKSTSPVFKVIKSNSPHNFSNFDPLSDTASSPTSIYFSNSVPESLESSTPKNTGFSQNIRTKAFSKKSISKSSFNTSASRTLFQFGFKKGNSNKSEEEIR